MRLYGKNSILERLKSAPQTINKIYIKKGLNLEAIVKLARDKEIAFIHMPDKKFFNFTSGIHCQGVVAEVDKFAYNFLEDFLNRPKQELLSLVFLDNVCDPQNLGGILRTLACFGGFALVIPRHKSAAVNDTVLKVACGGESFVPVAQVSNLSVAIELVKKSGYWVAGAVTEAGKDLLDMELPFPLAIVIGSEGKGIRPGVANHIDLGLTLPMPGTRLSFNVATATAIFCYEIFRQKSKGKR
ncbi:MAG: 23S rRNA (guanosine(2251)-2'-O)-methyltransferase RlmB [Candidatus Omnitrophica bacterium]|nr:23S rRNA (guanosine(2251)-2'-O)-methyltransferase RlmB [Candidatus Omnitrophota bacterium]